MNNNETNKIMIDETVYETRLSKKFSSRKKYIPTDPKKVNAVIPGIIKNVQARNGDLITEGDPLLVLEAMKMENAILAPVNGRIKEIYVKEGQMVTKGYLMLELE